MKVKKQHQSDVRVHVCLCPTRPISLNLVNMTTIVELFSQSILQKSSVVSARGPCVAM